MEAEFRFNGFNPSTCHRSDANRRDLHALLGAYCWCAVPRTSLQLSCPCWVFTGLVERKCRNTTKKRSWVWCPSARLPKMQEDSVRPFILSRSYPGHKGRTSASTHIASSNLSCGVTSCHPLQTRHGFHFWFQPHNPWQSTTTWIYMDVSENRGFSPQIIHFNRVCRFAIIFTIHFGVPVPLFLETPI